MAELTATQRKQRPMFRGLFKYFPEALEAVSNVSYVGNMQHNPGQDLHWDKSKSTDDADALIRHLKEHAAGIKLDTDGVSVLAKVAWRALAILERELEKDAAKPPTIGNRVVIKFLGFKPVGKSYMEGRWFVRCTCGREFECGDANHEKTWFGPCISCGQKTPKPSRRKRPFEYRYNAAASRTRHPFLISYDEFFEFTKIRECHYCGVPIVWGEPFGKNRPSGLNLDRKDSNLPYVASNLVVACRRCNYGKNNFFTYTEWKALGNMIRTWYAKEKP